MYSSQVIEQRLSRAAAALGVKPVRYPKEYCWDYAEHLDKLREPKTGELRRELRREEYDFIENEKLICQYDFMHWVERWPWISDEANRPTRVKPRIAQQIVTDVWASLEAKGREIVVMELKARQLGVSTWSELGIAHRVQFHEGVNAVVASSDQKRSEKMAKMMTLCWSKQPWWLIGHIYPDNRFEKGFPALGSAVSIQHGAQTSGIARGTTVTCAHLSEVSGYDDPDDLIDNSLMRAIHPNPWVFVVLESTALRTDDWWQFNWDNARTGYARGQSRFFPLFLPWFVGRDIYPTPTWLVQQIQIMHENGETYEDWRPEERTVLHAKKCEAFVREYPLLRKYVGAGWQMPKEQMLFWEQTRKDYVAKRNLSGFLRELCATDSESFQAVNTTAFDQELIIELGQEAEAEPVRAVFGLASRDIPEDQWPSRSEVVKELPKVVIDPSQFRIRDAAPITLYPIQWEGYSMEDGLGKALIFEFPQDGYEYVIGVDTADGIGLDRSVVEVVRKGNTRENEVQCAEFATSYMNAHDLWPVVTALACYYTVNRKDRKGKNHLRPPKVSIECNRNGESTQNEMLKRGWWNFHLWTRYDTKQRRVSNRLGWLTTPWSRSMVLDFGIKSVRDRWVEVRSPYLVRELGKLERDPNKQSLKAGDNCFDDRVMSFMIALFTMYDWEIRKANGGELPSRAQRAFQRQVAGNDPEYPRWRGPMGNMAMDKVQRKATDFFTGGARKIG